MMTDIAQNTFYRVSFKFKLSNLEMYLLALALKHSCMQLTLYSMWNTAHTIKQSLSFQ